MKYGVRIHRGDLVEEEWYGANRAMRDARIKDLLKPAVTSIGQIDDPELQDGTPSPFGNDATPNPEAQGMPEPVLDDDADT